MTKEDILTKLHSKKSADRRRAAKAIGKMRLSEFGKELLAAYLIEKQDKRTWETQTEMIKSLGLIDHKAAQSELEAIINVNKRHDRITDVATTSFIQLKRSSINDAQLVIELLKVGSISVISGALFSLPLDRMNPNENEVELLIQQSWDINKHPDRIGFEFGLIDPRIYLALSCADWNIKLTEGFLRHCVATATNLNRFNEQVENRNLIAVCENSLKGKFSKGFL